MSSKIDIQKRCKWCNAVFTAHKTTTEYCSHRCANLAYKDRVRKQRIESLQHELGKSIKTPPNLNKEYLTPSEVAELLNIGRTSIYRYIRNGTIKVIRFERKTLVRRADIENMTDYLSPENEKTPTKEKSPITDFYTTAEVKEKYHVNESWIFVVAKKNNIPRTFNRGKTYWSKKHIDATSPRKPQIQTLPNGIAPKNAGEVRYDFVRNLLFRFQECHSEEERGHHGVLFQEACGYCQRYYCTRRTAILYGS
jgi:excisionase family DNA binding protein